MTPQTPAERVEEEMAEASIADKDHRTNPFGFSKFDLKLSYIAGLRKGREQGSIAERANLIPLQEELEHLRSQFATANAERERLESAIKYVGTTAEGYELRERVTALEAERDKYKEALEEIGPMYPLTVCDGKYVRDAGVIARAVLSSGQGETG